MSLKPSRPVILERPTIVISSEYVSEEFGSRRRGFPLQNEGVEVCVVLRLKVKVVVDRFTRTRTRQVVGRK